MAVGPFRPLFAAAAAVLSAAAIAHADGADDQFLGLLARDGLNFAPPDQMIAIAHERCDAEGLSHSGVYVFPNNRGASPYMVAITRMYNELQSQGLATAQIPQFFGDAITAYCPH